jgi:hypothetical protein
MQREPCQTGFRAGHRVEDNIMFLHYVATRTRITGVPAYAVFLDVSKAYDSLDRA